MSTNKYASGRYLTLFFDRYGTKVPEKTLGGEAYMDIRDKAEELCQEGESFTILRVIYNSLD